jgi:hypothetical protein
MMKDRFQILKRMGWAAAAGTVLLLGGCGRSLPAIDAEVLAAKKSILILTAASLSENEIKALQTVSAAKAKENRIALEFVAKTPSLTQDLFTKIDSVPYDSVIAIGNELHQEVAAAAQRAPDKRFVLLGSGLTKSVINGALPANVLVKRLDESKKLTIWDDWVKLQKASGLNILWISKTSAPVPVSWVPSEEADRLLNMDVYTGDTWYSQLTFQAQALPAHWLALYSPVEDTALTRMRNLKIPVMDMSASLTTAYNWETILSDSMTLSLGAEWSGGDRLYSEQEVSITRK